MPSSTSGRSESSADSPSPVSTPVSVVSSITTLSEGESLTTSPLNRARPLAKAAPAVATTTVPAPSSAAAVASTSTSTSQPSSSSTLIQHRPKQRQRMHPYAGHAPVGRFGMPRFGMNTAQPHCPPLDLVTGMNRTWNYLCIFFNIALSESYRAQLYDKTRSAMMLCAELSAADPTYSSDPGVQDAVASARAWEATAELLGTDAFAKLGEHFAELTEARRVVHDRPGVAAAEVEKRVRQLYSLDDDADITTPHLDAEIVLTDLSARYDAAFRSLWSQDPISYLTSLTTADAPVAEARLLFDIVESMDKEGLMDHDALFPEDDEDDSGSSTSWAPRSHAQARDDAIAFERMRWEQCLARARERCMSVDMRRREWARVRVQELLDGGAGLAAWRRERSR